MNLYVYMKQKCSPRTIGAHIRKIMQNKKTMGKTLLAGNKIFSYLCSKHLVRGINFNFLIQKCLRVCLSVCRRTLYYLIIISWLCPDNFEIVRTHPTTLLFRIY